MERLEVLSPNTLSDEEFDWIYIGFIGFEHRSSFAIKKNLKSISGRRVAFAYTDRKVLNYDSNKQYYEENEFSIKDAEHQEIVETLTKLVEQNDEKKLYFKIDISCTRRSLLARLVHTLWDVSHRLRKEIAIRFLYSVAKYSPPPDLGPMQTAGPIISEFGGWTDDPRMPSTLLIGLGYEDELAVGLYEDLEAQDAWLLIPINPDTRYANAVTASNELLLELVGEDKRMQYPIDQPYLSFRLLDSLCKKLSTDQRLTLIPFGPKIFTLNSILTALCHHPKIQIYRLSSEDAGDPIDRIEDGRIITLDIRFNCGTTKGVVGATQRHR